ncbi:MAG: Gfo/Idh/MocA family oxidoreductase, partial [Porticoccaceae bacterium]|nr:Gfo/Idh/MocA family oxidoreductase [Porticoccaceae bacterium]
MKQVRFGIIGTGGRSRELLRLLLAIDGAEVNALCDIDGEALQLAKSMVESKGRRTPALYTGGDYAYRDLLERDDLDAVIVGTPWHWHVPMAVDCMNTGKQALVEVTAATTIDECWQLVETSEKTRTNCMMLENVCYGREEMMVLNMVRDGLFGELLHGEASYIHRLTGQVRKQSKGESQWRPQWHAKLDGNLYPTHGLGPVAQYMDINRGDQFDYLNSISSPAVGRREYIQENLPSNHPNASLRHIAGDMNTSLIKTKKGRTIMVQHDTTTPRPYTRHNMLQGTNGIFAGWPHRIALEENPLEPDNKEGFHHWDQDMGK